MTMTKALLLGAMLGLAAPALANSHVEKKVATAGTASTHHDGMADHGKLDTSKMSAKDKAAHDKMMRDAAKQQAAADKLAKPQ